MYFKNEMNILTFKIKKINQKNFVIDKVRTYDLKPTIKGSLDRIETVRFKIGTKTLIDYFDFWNLFGRNIFPIGIIFLNVMWPVM